MSNPYDWMLGIGLTFGLAFLMTYIVKGGYKTFFILLSFFCGFMVMTGLLEAWVLILCSIVSVFILITSYKSGES